MPDSTETQATPAPTKKVLAVTIPRNGVNLNFYETPFKRATDDSGKKGLVYPSPDVDEILKDLTGFLQWLGDRNAVQWIVAKLRQTCQSAFENNCSDKADSAGNLIKDDKGNVMTDYEDFDLEGFTKDMAALSVSTETKAELLIRQSELTDELIALSDQVGEMELADFKAAMAEKKAEIQSVKLALARKKRAPRTAKPVAEVATA